MQSIFRPLLGQRVLDRKKIQSSIGKVRQALVDADVHVGMVDSVIQRVEEQTEGKELLPHFTPGQQFTKAVYDSLVELLKRDKFDCRSKGRIWSCVLMCGLQGSGKTTTSVKLACHLQKQGKRVLIAACDLQRPAACEQLRILGEEAKVDVFSVEGEKDPVQVAHAACEEVSKQQYDVLIVDTAGRLHVDDGLMSELENIRDAVSPDNTLFVTNASFGQNAVRTVCSFHERINLSGHILSMMDSGALAGVALSVVHATGCPIFFEGTGEAIQEFREFQAESLVDRLLGMGDILHLSKQAEEHLTKDKTKELSRKVKSSTFSFDDYLTLIRSIKNMGSMQRLRKMMPMGMSDLGGMNAPLGGGKMLGGGMMSDKEFARSEAIVLAMTPGERGGKTALTHPRRRRIARGSGVEEGEVNRLLKQKKRAIDMMKIMTKKKLQKQQYGDHSWQ